MHGTCWRKWRYPTRTASAAQSQWAQYYADNARRAHRDQQYNWSTSEEAELDAFVATHGICAGTPKAVWERWMHPVRSATAAAAHYRVKRKRESETTAVPLPPSLPPSPPILPLRSTSCPTLQTLRPAIDPPPTLQYTRPSTPPTNPPPQSLQNRPPCHLRPRRPRPHPSNTQTDARAPSHPRTRVSAHPSTHSPARPHTGAPATFSTTKNCRMMFCARRPTCLGWKWLPFPRRASAKRR